eukprot:CAMPEP_0119041830 /NCGR_PEP_ID=MMETSP1177-20130426/13865_1 /TAXON_ID=2985 /ORGANISM="Ochromonas sp, Strain CCMP1899" /LENGTH=46 /DNA_ID= /DNA_START= /DNA_END= /DNA_ORIENTATION=
MIYTTLKNIGPDHHTFLNGSDSGLDSTSAMSDFAISLMTTKYAATK